MTKLADFYIKYKHDFAPYDWENRQSHLAALFTSDDGIIFGEGEPSEEQQEQGIPYAKIFNHRVYHLESNPKIIVMQFANSIDIPVEIHYENSLAKNEPSCFVIIDNREGMRTVAIQNRRKAFSAPKRVADIMTGKLNEVLFGKYCYGVEILPRYYPEDLFLTWARLQNVTNNMLFSPPDMSEQEVMERLDDFKRQGKEYYDDSLIPAMLQMAAAAKEDKYFHGWNVHRDDLHTAIYLDKTSTYMKNMLTLSRATNTPVKLVTMDGATYHCFVDSDEVNTDKIVHKELDENHLELLFTGKKKDGEKAEHTDIEKAETGIVEMLNEMKNTSVDACEG